MNAASTSEPREVTVVLFSDAGDRLKKVSIAKVIKTPDEWRKQLSPNAYDITRNADTEIAFSGKYWNLHDKGLYRCICCDNAVFDSTTKFESGTGWPSFWEAIAEWRARADPHQADRPHWWRRAPWTTKLIVNLSYGLRARDRQRTPGALVHRAGPLAAGVLGTRPGPPHARDRRR